LHKDRFSLGARFIPLGRITVYVGWSKQVLQLDHHIRKGLDRDGPVGNHGYFIFALRIQTEYANACVWHINDPVLWNTSALISQ
jgi:hypothetical protein